MDSYIFAAQAEAEAQVCSRHASAFHLEFERSYKAWCLAHAEALEKGAAIAQARGMTGDKPPSIHSCARLVAGIIDAIPEDDRQRRGDELLSMLVDKGAEPG